MIENNYYHMFANGADAKNFIISESDFVAAFNRIGVCAYSCNVTVVAASVEDTHPHVLLYGGFEQCKIFKSMYESMSLRYIGRRRDSSYAVKLKCELLKIEDDAYLKNVAAYTIVQATKDGKAIMPYDYLYGTGALYFRSPHTVLPWLVDAQGNILKPVRFAELTMKARRAICCSRVFVPDDWIVCNGIILPTNYVDINRFERIFKTHNCFRAFLCSGKKNDAMVLNAMAEARGLAMDDLEARTVCASLCKQKYGVQSSKFLNMQERLLLAQDLRSQYHLGYRQIAFLSRLPEFELKKYVR